MTVRHAQHSFPSRNCSKLKYPSHWEGPGVGPIQGITRFALDPSGGALQRKALGLRHCSFSLVIVVLGLLASLVILVGEPCKEKLP
ncbi:MAG: hypothetical protein CMC74_04600 [Flavobacteriaceae bacterium]|nr:hypothetical protein [Flavobacteriaceae bacterium]